MELSLDCLTEKGNLKTEVRKTLREMAINHFKEDGYEYRLTDEYEYKSFVLNNLTLKERLKAKKEYISGELSDVRFDAIMEGTTKQLKANYGKIVYKVSKYTLTKDKDLMRLILKLIKDLYDKKLFDYILDYLPSELKSKKTIEDYMKELVELK